MIKVNDVVMLKARAGGSAPAVPVRVLKIDDFLRKDGSKCRFARVMGHGAAAQSTLGFDVFLSDLEEIPVT
jgi:hypothetical protein